MLSLLALRHVIETAFLPTRCICTVDHSNNLMIQLINAQTQQEELTVTGIDPKDLTSSRAIAELVAQVREELRLRSQRQDKPWRHVKR
ncbi:DUF1652 domain-containing protein [Pseudomonas vanderleydeniana]|uniref:DUF1652 domain-containing protein n=1 Tax=Pseudomonas vanderleydeniana TaxID=2745495 RepID=A0A9E6PH77_9PSED|nr:DUF1652 domain-containing protein [Pseudomonas vanderleydeniana]QXI26345.1 DUF1652 domain-containing protein [Pseudomonas vanderleydeniana]